MKYRKLGSSDLEISEIGFGTWGIGGNSYGDVDDAESEKALHRAFEKGINFYDTANLYGDGHSEELLGKVFCHSRDKVIIATKGGTLPHTGFYMPQDFSPGYLRKCLEESLKRLKSDWIDVYQLHSPDLKVLEDGRVIEALGQFKSEGKIKEYGISVRSPDDGKVAIEKYGFKIVQVNFNMIDQRAIKNGMFSLVVEKSVGLIIRTPLVFGYLSGRLTGNEQFTGVDHRNNWPKDQIKRWAESPNLFSFLYENDKNRTLVQAALLFCLAFKEISTVIPGMLRVEEVDENVNVSELPPFGPLEIEMVREIYDTHEFYDKNVKHMGKQR